MRRTDVETAALGAQALQYLTADRSAPGTDNRVANRAEGELRDLGKNIAADRASGNLDDDVDDRRRGHVPSPP